MTQIIPTYTNNNGVRQRADVVTSDKAVILSDDRTLKDVVDESKEIKNGIENARDVMQSINVDEFSPVITQITSMSKIGKDDTIDVSANVNDGFFKSAILYGNTLINYATMEYWNGNNVEVTQNDGIFSACGAWGWFGFLIPTIIGKKYFVSVKSLDSDAHDRNIFARENDVSGAIIARFSTITDKYMVFTATTTTTFIGSRTTIDRYTHIIDTPIISEYQDGMENLTIPYFEGMKSVKMPVLTTTGKNLLDVDSLISKHHNQHVIEITKAGTGFIMKSKRTGTWHATNYSLQLKPYTQYVFKCVANTKSNTGSIKLWNNYERYLVYMDAHLQNTTNLELSIAFTTQKDGVILLQLNTTRDISALGEVEVLDVGIYESMDQTTYEPYKSNILSTPQDLELRGIGDVKDTLDLINGEKVERIGEIVLDGSEDWALQTNSTDIRGAIYRLSITDIDATVNNTHINCMCDKVMVGSWGTIISTRTDKTFAVLQNQQLRVQFDGSLEELRAWLSEVHPTVQYLKQEVVKRVPINGELLGFKDGHIMLSSGAEGYSPIPTLEYSVPVSKSAQITQNSATFARQSKQIYSLEILMMSASIEDAYRRLLLQNDVEVTRSINANLKENPLRYYVLSKLVEENAYDVDDMLAKLDIFSLYNEITIDQYIELSDKVLGVEEDIIEGEIIED